MATVLYLLVLILISISYVSAQQAYVNNKQLDCYNHYNNTDGYVCTNTSTSSCASYLTFRSTPPKYDTAVAIGYLLGANPSDIGTINNITDFERLPEDTLLTIPINCSCYNKQFYQHRVVYSLKSTEETYFYLSNNTYQGLTTCQSMMRSNPDYESRNFTVGLELLVPIMCACPTANQTRVSGINYLLTYLVTWGDSLSAIANDFFRVNLQSFLDANQLEADSRIYPYTPLLVPLQSVPAVFKINTSTDSDSATPPPPTSPIVPASSDSKSSKIWIVVGVGIGVAAIVVALLLVGVLFYRKRRSRKHPQRLIKDHKYAQEYSSDYTPVTVPDASNNSWSVSSAGVRHAIESLTEYKYEDLDKATGSFDEANKISGGTSSVYIGLFKGDKAAVKMMKGDVSLSQGEINILKQINHSNIIRLSGFCVHEGTTYLVYEYADNGSLNDWLHPSDDNRAFTKDGLGWKQRVQIAYDVSGALNYIHSYSNPPYVHKNLKSSNILLDANMRAKVTSFGLARSMDEKEMMQMTRHVVGTQGYMAPEYIENGMITPKLDVFAFGVILLELLSGREVTVNATHKDEKILLSETIKTVVEGENVRGKLIEFMDPSMKKEYPLDLAFSLAQLAYKCVSRDVNARPAMSEVYMTTTKMLSSSLDWDPSDDLQYSSSRSLSHGR